MPHLLASALLVSVPDCYGSLLCCSTNLQPSLLVGLQIPTCGLRNPIQPKHEYLAIFSLRALTFGIAQPPLTQVLHSAATKKSKTRKKNYNPTASQLLCGSPPFPGGCSLCPSSPASSSQSFLIPRPSCSLPAHRLFLDRPPIDEASLSHLISSPLHILYRQLFAAFTPLSFPSGFLT